MMKMKQKGRVAANYRFNLNWQLWSVNTVLIAEAKFS
jgi:hypothetical protein